MSDITKIMELLLLNKTYSQDEARRFFKTSPKSYAEKEEFIGVRVPILRKIANEFKNISLDKIRMLLTSKFNEERLLALLILVNQYQQAKQESDKKAIYNFYLENLQYVNNWNLVDSSAHLIMGQYLQDKDKAILTILAQSDNLWERRIAIIATWHFIKNKELEVTFKIARILLSDKHDLIHKAVGWMLRETGKQNEQALLEFLHENHLQMARTTLRYATEKIKFVSRPLA